MQLIRIPHKVKTIVLDLLACKLPVVYFSLDLVDAAYKYDVLQKLSVDAYYVPMPSAA